MTLHDSNPCNPWTPREDKGLFIYFFIFLRELIHWALNDGPTLDKDWTHVFFF